MVKLFGQLAHLDINFVAHRVHVFYETCGFAIRTRRADGALKRLLYSLAGDRDQSEIVKLQYFRWRTIAAESFFKRLHDFLPIAAFVHIDEIDDDDSTQIAQ